MYIQYTAHGEDEKRTDESENESVRNAIKTRP